MDVDRLIQATMVRVDMILCAIARRLPLIALLAVVLLLAVLAVRCWTIWDPYWIDYDAPGVDITSEGPDDDFTENYFREAD